MNDTNDTSTERNEKLATVLATLDEGVTAILDSAEYARYLRMLAKFYRYSARNVLLILAQCPDATAINSFWRWKELGRSVRKGEHGIRILAPLRRKVDADAGDNAETYKVFGFRPAVVFDIAQTEGEDLPAPPLPVPLSGQSDSTLAAEERVLEWLHVQGIDVRRMPLDGGRHGVYIPKRQTIAIDDRLGGDVALETLLHETAHHLSDRSEAVTRDDGECVAESVAYVVLAHLGIDAAASNFPYIAFWAQDRERLLRNLDEVRRIAHELIGVVSPEDEVLAA